MNALNIISQNNLTPESKTSREICALVWHYFLPWNYTYSKSCRNVNLVQALIFENLY